MKRKFSFILFASIALGSMVTSCSQDDSLNDQADNQATLRAISGIPVSEDLVGVWASASNDEGYSELLSFGNKKGYDLGYLTTAQYNSYNQHDAPLSSWDVNYIESFSSTSITFSVPTSHKSPYIPYFKYRLSDNKDSLYVRYIKKDVAYEKIPNGKWGIDLYFKKQFKNDFNGVWVSDPFKFAGNSREVYRFTGGYMEVSAVSEHSSIETIKNLTYTNAKSKCKIIRLSSDKVAIYRNINSSNYETVIVASDKKSFTANANTPFALTFRKMDF